MKCKLLKYLFLINITLFILFINTNSIYARPNDEKDEVNQSNESIIDEKDDRGQSGASNSKLNDNSTDGDWEYKTGNTIHWEMFSGPITLDASPLNSSTCNLREKTTVEIDDCSIGAYIAIDNKKKSDERLIVTTIFQKI